MNFTENSKLAGVIGWPIEHSKSPLIHNYWLSINDIEGHYVPLAVRPENLEEVVRTLPKAGFRGFNVTVPHKVAIMDFVDSITDEARRIGAVNTVTVENDGSLKGHNTDCFGFIENLKNSCPAWKPENGAAVVIGAGGASRAVCVALRDAGVKDIIITNRTEANAVKLAEEIDSKLIIVPWEKRAEILDRATLVVNTTIMGMKGVPQLDIDLSMLSSQAVVYDIVYNPIKTGLLRRAKVRGSWTVEGLGMLLHQAVPAFELWFGIKPEVNEKLYNIVSEK